MTFRDFEPWIREAAVEGCAEGIETIEQPIRFNLKDTYAAGETIDVAIENVGTRGHYVFQSLYQACFLSYFDSSGRRFIISPGTHCDMLAEETIKPGERKKLFTWSLDECVKDEWGCAKSRPLPPGTYTIKGRFKLKAGGKPARVETTFRIVATQKTRVYPDSICARRRRVSARSRWASTRAMTSSSLPGIRLRLSLLLTL
jgi:hypothetical protein